MSNFAGAAIKSMAVHKRKKSDVYPTLDAAATWAVLEADPPPPGCNVWEPACGGGHMARVIAQHPNGYHVSSTDIRKTGYGLPYVDFLATIPAPETPIHAIITNPPFNLADEFIRHALETIKVPYLALLLKTTFFNSGRGKRLHNDHPPTNRLPLTWRVAFLKGERGNSPLMDCDWFVWQAGATPKSFQPVVRSPSAPPDPGTPLLACLANLEEAVDELLESGRALGS